ncbi:hypothetical protein SAMN02799631_03193 [Methylobacterium sp. 174MFSha1.1]|uniref:hypothetical protein n=1 Tax=Methylobacterium sp. 174MFSha1.1 TaxID=1502749 RepID=UPI0008E9CAC1|nr:hypothetical protein [Methylobacterium sp. 174MFSha1.1]SFU92841.1 hypothetical protein SAMN02799631_03193 [Methylobacterium sp. 174MFSha1.1]
MLARIRASWRRLLGAKPAPAPPAREPWPMPEVVRAPRQSWPVAELVQQHARVLLYRHERLPDPLPLPAPLQAWVGRLDATQLGLVIGCEAYRLHRHLANGLEGGGALGPFRLPPVLPGAAAPPPASGGGGGKGGPPRSVDLAEALAELGLTPAYTYGPRR